MKISLEERKTTYLYETPVENIFIGEYMPDAPGEYVKVYLYALMEAGSGRELEDFEIARALSLSEEEVRKAFKFFTLQGLIEVRGASRVFVNIREKLYGNKNRAAKQYATEPEEQEAKAANPAAARLLYNEPIRKMMERVQEITGRFAKPAEQETIKSWIGDYGVDPDMVTKLYEYCMSRDVDNDRYREKVMQNWLSHGFTTREQVEDYLERTDERHYQYKKIMKTLGFSRNPSEPERKIMDGWFDDLGCSMKDVLDACGKTTGISNPNLNYIDKVLRGQKGVTAEGATSRRVVSEYYEYLRAKAKKEAERARDEVFARVPRIAEIEEELRDLGRDLTTSLIGGGADKAGKIEEIERRIDSLDREKSALMTANDIPIDYMDEHYLCGKCKDTGVTDDGARCSCYLERAAEAAAWKREQQ